LWLDDSVPQNDYEKTTVAAKRHKIIL